MTVKRVTDRSLFPKLGVREAGRGFLISLKASNGYSDSYLDVLERSVALLALYAEEEQWPPVGNLTTSHVEEYLTYLRERPRWFGAQGNHNPRKMSQGYIAAQYRRLNRFFGWLVERGHVDSNPLALIKPPRVDERTVPTVAERQMQELLMLVDPGDARGPVDRFLRIRNRAVLFVLWDTPGRRTEISTATLSGVDLDSGALLVKGKGGRERWMPLGDTVISLMWEYLQARATLGPRTEALWVAERGQAMQPAWLYQMLTRLGSRAGIANLHTHRFRHSYAVNALRGGMPERVLQLVGGWKKIPPTYFRTLGEEDAQNFHRQVSPGDRLGQGTSGRGRQRREGKPRGKL